VRRSYPVLLCAAILLLILGLAVGALDHSLGAVLFCSLALYVADYLLRRTENEQLLGGLGRIGAGSSWRFFYRDILVLVFLLRTGELSRLTEVLLVAMIVAHHGVHVLFLGLRLYINYRRNRQFESRNLAVPGEVLPPPPPELLMERGTDLVLHTDLFLVAALGWAFVAHTYDLVSAAAVLSVAAALLFAAALVPQALALSRLGGDADRLEALHGAIAALSPTVVLYFSGDVEAVYQVNMWLETMERLDRPTLVVLRENKYLDDVKATTVPVLCMPSAVDFMNFPLPTVRAALYVANVGKNIHLLRLPAVKSAFIGHGDSDKTASFNPFAKVYDQVWVAGEAGRQRYLRAEVGVRADEIVLVGRPQLDAIEGASARLADAPFTVLYAPTWEGWTEDPHQSSLIPMGREIVSTLLATEGVRIIYKPHPLTGTVKRRAQQVSDEIVAMMAAAGPQHVSVSGERTLYDCFNESDALISDISSVVSDYLRSEKPYFVSNGGALPDAQFRDRNPSAGAAYLIGPHASGLADGLAAARADDPLRGRRSEVRTYLLGAPHTDSMTLFRMAVDRLVDLADAHAAVDRLGPGDDDELLEQRAEQRAAGEEFLSSAEDLSDV
jgi:hypothetical protein